MLRNVFNKIKNKIISLKNNNEKELKYKDKKNNNEKELKYEDKKENKIKEKMPNLVYELNTIIPHLQNSFLYNISKSYREKYYNEKWKAKNELEHISENDLMMVKYIIENSNSEIYKNVKLIYQRIILYDMNKITFSACECFGKILPSLYNLLKSNKNESSILNSNNKYTKNQEYELIIDKLYEEIIENIYLIKSYSVSINDLLQYLGYKLDLTKIIDEAYKCKNVCLYSKDIDDKKLIDKSIENEILLPDNFKKFLEKYEINISIEQRIYLRNYVIITYDEITYESKEYKIINLEHYIIKILNNIKYKIIYNDFIEILLKNTVLEDLRKDRICEVQKIFKNHLSKNLLIYLLPQYI
jgi:hypothetical protein